jgi:hypothetical protein
MAVDKMPGMLASAVYYPVNDHNRFPPELQDKFPEREANHV